MDCGVSRDGASAKNIIQAARSYGCEAKAWRVDPEDLIEEGPFPCILHWGFNHFVVLCGFRGGKAVLNDPARGRLAVSMEEFDREYTGVMITIEPTENFKPSGKRKGVMDYARESLTGTSAAVAFVVLTTTISSLLGVISPVFGRVFLDRQNTNASIAGTLVNTFAPLAINTMMMVFYLSVMLKYSAMITSLADGGAVITVLRNSAGMYVYRDPTSGRMVRVTAAGEKRSAGRRTAFTVRSRSGRAR